MQALPFPPPQRMECCVFSKIKSRAGRGLAALAALLGLAFLLTTGSQAALRHETEIAGYELKYGTSPGNLNQILDVGLKTSTTLSDLSEGVTYYIVVSAYNKSGLRSAPSKMLRYRRPARVANRAPDGEITTPSTGGNIVAGQSVDFSAAGSDPDGDAQLAYRWNFGSGSGIADSTLKDPAAVRFTVPGIYQVTLTTTDSRGLSDPSPATRTITVLGAWSLIPRSGWKLKYVNSEEPNGYAATRSFDGDPTTFWHTRWTAANLPPPPHQIQIDLGASRTVKGFQYLPRQDGYRIGTISKYEFYVSKDGVHWGKPVATGTFAASTTEKRVFCTPKQGKFIRLVSLSEANGATDCSVAELNILQGPPLNRRPSAISRGVRTAKNKPLAITLGGSDPDRNPLTYQIVSRPQHGTLSGTPPRLTYKPDSKFTGTDVFTFRIHDGLTISKTATVRIQVTGPGGSSTKESPLAAAATEPSTAGKASAAIVNSVSAARPAPRSMTGVEIIAGEKYLTLTAAKPAVPDGLKRRVEVSPNLVDWFSGNKHTTVIEDNTRFLKVRDNTPLVPGRKRHIRLHTGAR